MDNNTGAQIPMTPINENVCFSVCTSKDDFDKLKQGLTLLEQAKVYDHNRDYYTAIRHYRDGVDYLMDEFMSRTSDEIHDQLSINRMETPNIDDSSNKIPIAIPYRSTALKPRLSTAEANEFVARNQFRLALVFSGIWLSYCWWLSERYRFDFGQYTTIIRLLFCVIHVLTVWKFFQYIIKIAFRLYGLSKRIRAALPRHLTMIVLSLVLFALLTFVLNFKQFLRDAFAIVD
ncbi:unnamed protein product [Rotaria magnacalcarata]|uniref:Uncharacterized protein n=2 Tax=Rotaria magnacalcarata TaxID=392030 RepID=A0A8S2J148_9BILA|nr:unnamed protein product [Rotaria magnacalcarata]